METTYYYSKVNKKMEVMFLAGYQDGDATSRLACCEETEALGLCRYTNLVRRWWVGHGSVCPRLSWSVGGLGLLRLGIVGSCHRGRS
jgi:hypothetical protein